ncbi:hypothetical protein [Haloarchaeobius sp. DT45]|uniref:hypothetical protein n=1 Tax=Haloarchaeobius sp. DT45 TaxID=3446116 RepID=UPI003F6AE800
MKRRTYLSSCCATGAIGLTGCLDGYLPSGDGTTRLGRLGVSNEDEERGHEFRLRVERDGDVVHESSHELEKDPESQHEGSGAAVDCTWGGRDGRYVVFARIDDSEWVEKELTEDYEQVPDCVIAVAIAGRQHPAIEVYDWCGEYDEDELCTPGTTTSAVERPFR